MKNKRAIKNRIAGGVILFSLMLIAYALFAFAQGQQDLQSELSQLESELASSGYGWLVNYSSDAILSSGKIGVYELNGTTKIAEFSGIGDYASGGAYYKIYLTNLTGPVGSNNTNYSQSTFDLKMLDGTFVFDHIIDPEINPAAETGLVALYHFNRDTTKGENDTWVYDFSGNNNNGTGYGSPWTANSKQGNALRFDGVDDYVNLGNNASLNITGSITISAWVKADSFPNYAMIATKGDVNLEPGWELRYTGTTGKIEFYTRTSGGVRGMLGTTVTQTGIWYHVVSVYNSTNALLYINGISEGTNSGTATGSDFNNSRNLNIGRRYNSATSQLFNGTIDEVLILNCSVNAANITAANNTPGYKMRCDDNTNGLVLDMPFNESGLTTTVARDWSPSVPQNNGTLTNFNFNPVWSSSGKQLGAVEFDGVDDKIQISHSASLNFTNISNYSISMWVNPNSNQKGTTIRLISKPLSGNPYPFEIRLSNTLIPSLVIYDGTNNPTAESPDAISANQWHHLVGVRDTGTDLLYIYVDGILKNNVSDTTTGDLSNNQPIYIVSDIYTSSDTWFNGLMDELAIYNRALNASEILLLYNIGLPNASALTNVWNCTSGTQYWTNTSCWTLGRVPQAYDDVVFNSTGLASVNITNNTMPQNLNSFTVNESYTGTIYFQPLFAQGTWGSWSGTQLWNVTNNIIINNGTMKIYGDAYNDTALGMRNITSDGHGQEWRSVGGNITIGSWAQLDGVGLGFLESTGPGGSNAYDGGRYGGGADQYGNASAPTSLGSGGLNTAGGSGIKLHASDLIETKGSINVSGSGTTDRTGAGGSIWLKANNISGNGALISNGGGTVYVGSGGRIRLEYGSTMLFNGVISINGGQGLGSLTFTNNTWPSDWNLTGNIRLLGGNFGDGNVTNVLGNFNTNNYNISIQGDCYSNKNNPLLCYNKTSDGRGVWINASGNITITSGSVLNGQLLGFPANVGPGAGSGVGGTYGGRGALNTKSTYGSETEPVSLGSGGGDIAGGSAIKLESLGTLFLNGVLVMNDPSGSEHRGAGGSIWLKANNISGSGTLNASGGSNGNAASRYAGAGGRIALTSTGTISFTGIINNLGGINTGYSSQSGSGGTVFINATTSITSSGNISVAGKNGSNGADWGQRINITAPLMILSGIYNASKLNMSDTNVNGTITLSYTNCFGSDTTKATFNPAAIYVSGSCSPGINLWNCTTGTQYFNNASCWSLGRAPAPGDSLVFNSTGLASVNITNNTMPQNLNSFTVNESYTGTIYFQPLFAQGTWGSWQGTQLWNVTNNIIINNGTMKIYGDAYNDSALGMKNITADGHGQEWRSVEGNISVGVSGKIDGVGLGFTKLIGPGAHAFGASHGGVGAAGSTTKQPYGNASAPTSLGSGGQDNEGGSAIKLFANELIDIKGIFNFSAIRNSNDYGGAGGSIWLKADNIAITGAIKADGNSPTSLSGGGGRIRLEYGSSMNVTGTVSVSGAGAAKHGTLTFTNNTWPGDWSLTGNIGLLGGDYDGDGTNVTNVLGNFNTNGYNITIYGDCFYNATNPSTCWNKTSDGRGVWINTSGNITITSTSVLDGDGLGFPVKLGPGTPGGGGRGASYGGKGGLWTGSSAATYGSETEPVSLGSGSFSGTSLPGEFGGSAVVLQSSGNIVANGTINMRGTSQWAGGSGGSVLLKASTISGTANINVTGGSGSETGGGGGRIALISTGAIEFSGVISSRGGNGPYSITSPGSGGTVYINATTSITHSGNISVVGYNGSLGADWGQRINITSPLLTLSGIYNASKLNMSDTNVNGTITLSYTNCFGSDTTKATFAPAAIYVSGSCSPGTNLWNCTSGTQYFNNASCWSLGRAPAPGDSLVFNSTGLASVNITNNTMPQNLNSFTVNESYGSGTIYFQPLFAQGTWGTWAGTQLWNVTNNIYIGNGTMKIYGDAYNDTALGMRNITADGHGQEWRSVSGNISIGVSGKMNGVGLGFTKLIGPGGSTTGGTYGGKGGSEQYVPSIYGNASAPTSLGSGGGNSAAGSAIKLQGDSVIIDGSVNMSGVTNGNSGSGGSIWLKANNISGSGILNAFGGHTTTEWAGGGGRIRLEYRNSMSYTGKINLFESSPFSGKSGSLTFTNNTWPGDWNLTGNIGLLGGNYGEGNVTNVLGNFNTNGYNMTIYGDCFYNATNPVTCYNKTDDGRGVWINASSNITITSGSVLDGVGLGFPANVGPGNGNNNAGGTYGGKGRNANKNTYGSETEPVSLGSGGGSSNAGNFAGSAIKLESLDKIVVNGLIDMKSTSDVLNSGSGGSIWIKANNISGTGILNASSGFISDDYYAGGGGRIALISTGNISFSGIINNKGGLSNYPGSGGTVYINASTSITSSGNISVVGYNGTSAGGSDWGQRINITAPLLTLSGIYNASRINASVAGTSEGQITLNYTDCGSSFNNAIFNPDAVIYQTTCTGTTAGMGACGELNWTNHVYYLQNDVNTTGTCFNVTANSVTLDCQGYMVNYSTSNLGGNPGYGVYSNKNFTNVRNCRIIDSLGPANTLNRHAVYYRNALNGIIQNNTINISSSYLSVQKAIYLLSSDNAFVANNTLNLRADSQYGIYEENTNNSIIQQNVISTLSSSIFGVYLINSSNNSFSGNRINNSQENAFYIFGVFQHYNNTLDSTNLVEGLPLNYTFAQNNLVFEGIDNSYGQVIVAWSNNITVQNSNFSADGVAMFYSNNSRILNSNITTSVGNAIYLYSSPNATINNSRINILNPNKGVQLISSSSSSITNNIIRGLSGGQSNGNGIYLSSSNYSRLDNNTISTSGANAVHGIYFVSSSNSNITNSNISTSGTYSTDPSGAIYLTSSSNANNIINSTITNSRAGVSGIWISGSSNNYIEKLAVANTWGDAAYGLRISGNAYDNLFRNLNINSSGGGTSYGIYINTNKVNATIENGIINVYNSTSNPVDIYADTALTAGSYLKLLNVTFNKSDTSINDADFTLYNLYYLDVNVTSTAGSALSGANVTGQYVNGTTAFSELTAANGFITRQNLTEYTQNTTGTFYVTPYNVTTIASGYSINITSVNLTTNIQDDVIMQLVSAGMINGSSIGLTTGKIYVNHNESVNLTLNIPASSYTGSSLSKVWAEIKRPDGAYANVTLRNSSVEIWNATYSTSGRLGDYNVTFKANLTNSQMLFENVYSNFSVQNTSIKITPQSLIVNTTDIVPVSGLIKRWNGSDSWAIGNNRFVMKLNGVTVSSDMLGDTSFTAGNGTSVNISSVVKLNLTSASGGMSYNDNYSTNKYVTDAYNYSSIGYAGTGDGRIFEVDSMTSNIGNITYRYTSPTAFYNASVNVLTASTGNDGNGNTSIWYSYNATSWNLMNSSTSIGAMIRGSAPVNGRNEFYVMLKSVANTATGAENPISEYNISYTQWQYNSSGNFVSRAIDLANMTYTVLKWDQNTSEQTIKVQLRESDDNVTWTDWSSNFTNNLDNSITSYSKRYLQYKAIFETTNFNVTPILYAVNISYFNATTNSSGGYDYNITIPTDALGILPLEISVVQNPNTGIVGANSTNITVWARTDIPYAVTKNYTGSLSQYIVYPNFTRTDTNGVINGSVTITIYKAGYSTNYTCSGGVLCTYSYAWTVATNPTYGNYTINITANNETGYYRNASVSYLDYLEQRNTSGNIGSNNKVISDLQAGVDYSYLWNVTINNTGNASMNSAYIWAAAKSGDVKNVTQITPCSKVWPGQSCNAIMNITVDGNTGGRGGGSGVDPLYITWRGNWSDNDGSIAGGATYIQATSYINVSLNATMALSAYSSNWTVQQGRSQNFSFLVQSIGTDTVTEITLSFVNETLPFSWVNITPSTYAGLIAGTSFSASVNISVPLYTSPGNYTGNVSVVSANAGSKNLTIRVEVPTNTSWYLTPSTNLTYNKTFGLSTAGEIGNFSVVNTGNVNMTFAITYSQGTLTGEEDYTLYSGLFEENKNVNGLVYNPTLINATKGSNTTITLYQNGWSQQELSNVVVNMNIANASASPISVNVKDAFWIVPAPPQITGIWFLLDGAYGTKAEVNKNVTIKFRATDAIGLNLTGNSINVTRGGIDTIIAAIPLNSTAGEFTGGQYKTVLNYTGNFTPLTSGVYYAYATVYSTGAKKNTSIAYNFTAYGTTSINFNENISDLNISRIDKTNNYMVYVNYSLNNTGNINAYDVNLTLANSSIDIIMSLNNYSFGTVGLGSSQSKIVQINVSKLTWPGTYSVTASLRYMHADTSIETTARTLTLNVLSNKSISFDSSIVNISVLSGSSNWSALAINNTGNDNLTGMNLVCVSGEVCTGFTITFNESNFAIARNGSRIVNINSTAGSGKSAGTYSGIINVTEQNISRTINISIVVPESLTWSASPLLINSTKAAGQSGTIREITISNTGNVNITFLLNSTNSSIVVPNMSSIEVPLNANRSFMVNYTSPSADGSYITIITMTNSSAIPVQINVSVNLTATNLNISIIYPTSVNQITGATAGSAIQILANATFSGDVVSSDSVWSAIIGGSSCSSLSAVYSSSNVWWNITCTAPSITNGMTYNLTLTLTHAVYGEVSKISANSIAYRDVTPPVFNSIARNSIEKSSYINLSANVTDNVAVDKVIATVTSPNGTISNYTLTLSNGQLYNLSSFILNSAGEYIVNYSANDTTGNVNTTEDWFEVYDRYNWALIMIDYNNNPVAGVNISLARLNKTNVLVNNITGSDGRTTLSVNKMNYDLHALISGDKVIVRNVNLTNITNSGISLNMHKMNGNDLAEVISLYKPFIGISLNSTNLSTNTVNVIFNYTGYSYDEASQLAVVKCADWNYSLRKCNGGWSAIVSSIDRDTKQVTGNSTGFSSYFLAEKKCGNGLCETTYGETTSTCSNDCPTLTVSLPASSSGGGGGLGSGDLSKIENLIKSSVNIAGIKVEITSIYKELFAGDSSSFRMKFVNTLNSKSIMSLEATGDIQPFIFFETSTIELEPNEIRDVLVKIVIPKFQKPTEYDGTILFKSGDKQGEIPVTIKVLSPEGKLLDVKIQPLQERVAPGDVLRYQLDLLNLGKTKRIDVQFDMQMLDAETGALVGRQEEAFAVETSTSMIKEFKVPSDTPLGKYLLKGTAYYSSLEEENQQASSIAYVNVNYSIFKMRIVGIELWIYLVALLIIGLIVGAFYYLRYIEWQKRRFRMKVEFNKLPQAGPNSAFVGKVAETGIRAFIDLNKLQMHTFVAGSTGSGKTVAAQDIIEAALVNKKSVIVFDPTAQWTGFLRKCEDSGMLKRYGFFDMKTGEARAFDGSIKTIHDPYEMIDIKKYMNRPGEITVFNISHLTPKEIDIVVASTIDQIFKSEPDENKELKTLIVYDEVHRLLPKFGGTGQGFIQLERGAREFRKWGIGLVLISQVLSDFVGEIKANIGTEVQMGTRYEGDLERVNMKYGEDILKSVVKEPIGTGMVVNAEFNLGKPYFIAFRPLLHSTRRLSNNELKNYEKYFDIVEDLDYQVEELKKEKVDVLDLELELKLAKSKIKSGQFQMADMYLESLTPKFDDAWKKLGKRVRHFVAKKVEKSEVEKAISEAEKERAEYIKKNPEVKISISEELDKIKRAIADKKKSKNTANVENKFSDLQNRLKGIKKVDRKDAEGVQQEIEELKKEVDKL